MSRALRVVIMMVVVCLLAGMSSADVYVFTGDGHVDGDVYETFIGENRVDGGYLFGGGDRNYGSSTWCGANETANGRSLLRFDVSSLTAVGPITSIELRLYQQGGTAADVSFHTVGDTNSNWQECYDTGTYTSWAGVWNRTTWNNKLRGLGDDAWDPGPGLGAAGSGFEVTPVAAATTTGSGWQSFEFTGDLDALIADWAQSPVVQRENGRFADPEEFTVVDNPGLLMIAQNGWAEFSSSEGTYSPELIVTTADVSVPGDFTGDTPGSPPDGDVDTHDIDALCDNMGSADPTYDLDDGSGTGTPDGVVDANDFIYEIEHLVELSDGIRVGTKAGDFNLDGLVNATDLANMNPNFGGSGMLYADGNANCDDVVNATDLAVLAAAFGYVAPAAAVPEPLSLSLIGVGALVLMRRRK